MILIQLANLRLFIFLYFTHQIIFPRKMKLHFIFTQLLNILFGQLVIQWKYSYPSFVFFQLYLIIIHFILFKFN